MNGAAIMLSTNIHMNGCSNRLAGDRSIAQGRIERRVLVRKHHKLGGWPAKRFRFGDTLLQKHDFRTGIEEEAINTSEGQGRNNGFTSLFSRQFDPSVRTGCRVSN